MRKAVFEQLADRRLGPAGHAVFETFSQKALAANFPDSRYLGPAAAAEFLASLAEAGVAGGSVYDALVGACARGSTA